MSEMEKMVFGRRRTKKEHLFGIHKAILAGKASDEKIRRGGASGGVVTALLTYLFDNKLIDGAVAVGFQKEEPWRAEAKVLTSREDIISCAQSKHQMVPSVSKLKTAVFDYDLKRIGFVGLPCHIHAIRKMQLGGIAKEITSRITLLIGLFEGANEHLEGTKRMINWLYPGMSLKEILKIEYRGGEYPGTFIARTRDGRTATVSVAKMWRYFSSYYRDRCLMCLDYAAELADISCGDIKVPTPSYTAIITRTEQGVNVLRKAEADGWIQTTIPPENVLIVPFHAGLEKKKFANFFRIEKRKSHNIRVPNIT
jgi:coenzyme F420 hydrogenase subunit beta